jgi:GNAT superfamily N-acetyltransferase
MRWTLPWSIRRATARDAEFLADMLVEAVNWSPEWKPKSRRRVLSYPRTAHYIAGWPRDTDLGLIAEASSQPVGAAWVRFFPATDPGYGFVGPDIPELTIGVAAPWRGRGVGRDLLRAIAAAAAEAGTGRISLSVERKNFARGLYLSEGYTVADASDPQSDTMVKNLTDAPPGRRAHLVLHDYGMGGRWWWIRASSAEQITATFAEVEVVTDPDAITRARARNLSELDIEDATRGELADLHQTRQRQRQDPAFGRLFGKERVYPRMPDDEGQATHWLTEHGPDGRRLRQVESRADGTALTTDLATWPINPPFDLGDPRLAAHEISRSQGRARRLSQSRIADPQEMRPARPGGNAATVSTQNAGS